MRAPYANRDTTIYGRARALPYPSQTTGGGARTPKTKTQMNTNQSRFSLIRAGKVNNTIPAEAQTANRAYAVANGRSCGRSSR